MCIKELSRQNNRMAVILRIVKMEMTYGEIIDEVTTQRAALRLAEFLFTGERAVDNQVGSPQGTGNNRLGAIGKPGHCE